MQNATTSLQNVTVASKYDECVTTMCQALDKSFYQVTKTEIGTKIKKLKTTRLATIVQNFNHMISLVCSKQLLEPLKPLLLVCKVNK